MAEDEATVHKILPSTLVKGGYLMIKKNPCWVTEITAKVGWMGGGVKTLRERRELVLVDSIQQVSLSHFACDTI